jgi:hypothetical protein
MADKDKKITVKEFKMWLQGVEEMQEEGWTPSPTQWKRIRDKIECLFEAAPQPTQGGSPIVYRDAPQVEQQTGLVVSPPPANIRSSVPATAPTYTAPPAATYTVPPGAPFATGDGKTPVRPPMIDTSDGNYKSPFG